MLWITILISLHALLHSAPMPSTTNALSAKLIFPTKEIVEDYYLPLIYTVCRTCYSELMADEI